MFTRLAVISIPVSDQQAAKAFSTERVGCAVVDDRPFGPEGATRWIRLALPGVETTITLVTWFPQMPPGSMQGLVLTTDDLTAAHTTLTERGVAISAVAHQPWGRKRRSATQTGTAGCCSNPPPNKRYR